MVAAVTKMFVSILSDVTAAILAYVVVGESAKNCIWGSNWSTVNRIQQLSYSAISQFGQMPSAKYLQTFAQSCLKVRSRLWAEGCSAGYNVKFYAIIPMGCIKLKSIKVKVMIRVLT